LTQCSAVQCSVVPSLTLDSSCLAMLYIKAESLFHLSQFEQSLLHFHNGLVSGVGG
jgi:hypothetical protein